MAALSLSPHARRAFDRLAADARRVFAGRFVAVVAYGPASGLVFASSVTAADLDALGVLTETWHRDGLATPLLVTPDEFRRSLDAFPLEYQAILDRHLLIDGASPFDGARVGTDDLRRACEIEARAHLIHLRQGWIEAAGHSQELAELIARSAVPLRALLANLARLHGREADDTEALARLAEELAGLPGELVRTVLALESASEPNRALVARLPEYLDASEQLWSSIDRWRTG